MNRAERRRKAKEVARGIIKFDDMPRSRLMPTAIIGEDGKKYTDLDSYLDYREKAISDQCSEIASKFLFRAEEQIAVINIIVMLYAVKLAVGNLKTVQKSYSKILSNYNEAQEYVSTVGLRQAYEEFNKEYGVEFNFEDIDLSEIFDNKKLYEMLKIKLSYTDRKEG